MSSTAIKREQDKRTPGKQFTAADGWVVAALLAVAGIICAIGLLLGSDSEFAGADSQATEEIESVAGDYQPWFEPVFEPGSGEIESGLFGVQAAIGGIIVGYAIGTLRNRSKLREAQARLAAVQARIPADT